MTTSWTLQWLQCQWEKAGSNDVPWVWATSKSRHSKFCFFNACSHYLLTQRSLSGQPFWDLPISCRGFWFIFDLPFSGLPTSCLLFCAPPCRWGFGWWTTRPWTITSVKVSVVDLPEQTNFAATFVAVDAYTQSFCGLLDVNAVNSFTSVIYTVTKFISLYEYFSAIILSGFTYFSRIAIFKTQINFTETAWIGCAPVVINCYTDIFSYYNYIFRYNLRCWWLVNEFQVL